MSYKTGKMLAVHMKKLNSTWCGTELVIPYEVYNFFDILIDHIAKE